MPHHDARVLGTRRTPFAWRMFAAGVVLATLGCGQSGGDSGDSEIPDEVEMRPVDGTPSPLPLPGTGLAEKSSTCPAGSVIKRVQIFTASAFGAFVGIELGCSEVELVEEDAILRIEFGPIVDLPVIGSRSAAGGTITGLFCHDNGVVTHIASRVTNDERARLVGIDVECTPLFLVGAGTGIEPALGAPIEQTAGSAGGFPTLGQSCLDPEVDSIGGLAIGVIANASEDELGSLVPDCRRPEIDF